jgi:hypothetical protein
MNETTLIKSASTSPQQDFASKCDNYLKSLLTVCDIADASGQQEEADKIASKFETIGLIKLAQYESGTSYWMANSRAFEKAYLEKIKKKDYTPHKAWWEVLEEYQESVLSNQLDFNKYAGQKRLSIEKTASQKLLNKITDCVEKHGSPGVAICQALQDFENGNVFVQAVSKINSSIYKIAKYSEEKETLERAIGLGKSLLKEAGFFNWLGKPINQILRPVDWAMGEIANATEEFGYGVKGIGTQVGPHNLTQAAIAIKNAAQDIFGMIKLARSGTEDKEFVSKHLNPIKQSIDSFNALAMQAGVDVPSFQELSSIVAQGLNQNNVDTFAMLFSTIYQAASNDQLLHRITKSVPAIRKEEPPKNETGKQEESPNVRSPLGSSFVKSIKDWAMKNPVVVRPNGETQPMSAHEAGIFESILMIILRQSGNLRVKKAKIYNTLDEIQNLVDKALGFLGRYNIKVDPVALSQAISMHALQTAPEAPVTAPSETAAPVDDLALQPVPGTSAPAPASDDLTPIAPSPGWTPKPQWTPDGLATSTPVENVNAPSTPGAPAELENIDPSSEKLMTLEDNVKKLSQMITDPQTRINLMNEVKTVSKQLPDVQKSIEKIIAGDAEYIRSVMAWVRGLAERAEKTLGKEKAHMVPLQLRDYITNFYTDKMPTYIDLLMKAYGLEKA